MVNDREIGNNRKRLAIATISAAALIILVQFVDSYCTEIFGKTQSLSVRTFLMDPRGMSSDAAVAYMSRGMLPFYLIGALTPFIRSYTDIIGRKKMMLINVSLLILGSVVCLMADSLWVYLLGNGILILGYSLDIHLIYIVDAIDKKHRGTIRGICGGVSMAAAMCIPLLRSLCVDGGRHRWQWLFGVGVMGGLFCLMLVMIYKFPGVAASDRAENMTVNVAETSGGADYTDLDEDTVEYRACDDNGSEVGTCANGISDDMPESDGHIHFFKTFRRICEDKKTRNLLLSISVVGLATVGITYYNEPMCVFSGMGESSVNMILFMQPVAALVINVITGILADHIDRVLVVRVGIVLSLIAGVVFTLGVGHISSAVLLGVLWGCMNGFYFSAEELINLLVMESVDGSVRGRASAMSTLSYGVGDQIGIFLISLVVGALGMRWAKMLFLVPPLAVAYVLIRSKLRNK